MSCTLDEIVDQRFQLVMREGEFDAASLPSRNSVLKSTQRGMVATVDKHFVVRDVLSLALGRTTANERLPASPIELDEAERLEQIGDSAAQPFGPVDDFVHVEASGGVVDEFELHEIDTDDLGTGDVAADGESAASGHNGFDTIVEGRSLFHEFVHGLSKVHGWVSFEESFRCSTA
jgi:hypothetical protein